MSMLVVRSYCFISYYSSVIMSTQNNVLLQIIFLSLGSRPLLFMIYKKFLKIVTVTFENVC